MTRDAYRPAPATGGEPARATALTIPVVTRPLRYALRMAAFLAVVGIVAALLHEDASRFFLRNPPLNALILSVLGLGIGLSFRAVLSLDPAVSWIQRFHRSDPDLPGDGPPPLLGPLAALLRAPSGGLTLTATGMRSVLDGIDSRLDERRDTLRYLIALLVFLGLLGTFWGLLMTANSVGETIRSLNITGSDPAEMFRTLRAGLEAPLSGMGTAFSTSLFGLASSLVLGFLDLQASHAQNRFANEAESWLSSLTRLDGGPASGDEGAAPSYLYALLERTAERFDELRGRLDHSLDATRAVMAMMRPLGERIANLTDELRASNGSGADAQRETVMLLRRIAGALEGGSAGIDDATREHLRNLDRALERLIAEATDGRDHIVGELRNEIRLLARTLSVIADRGR